MNETRTGRNTRSGMQTDTCTLRERLRNVRKRKRARDRLAPDGVASQTPIGERRKKREH